MIDELDKQGLVSAARAAVAKAFLTKEGGRRYGAAVLTSAGNVYTSGQYSSFNHITNIHAEMGAVLMATMSGDADVVALALATSAGAGHARPCGICRQFLAEHCTRTGRDIEVIMCGAPDGPVERARLSELLPLQWQGRVQQEVLEGRADSGKVRTGPGGPGPSRRGGLRTGDHVVLSDGCIALVWDPVFTASTCLAKVKYAPCGDGMVKLPHSFAEPQQYVAHLHDLGWGRDTGVGPRAAVVTDDDVREVMPILPLADASPPAGLVSLLERAELGLDAVAVTGSRATGMSRGGSDWDLIVHADAEAAARLRRTVVRAIADGDAALPASSGTWTMAERMLHAERCAIVRSGRYADTVAIGEAQCAFVFVPPTQNEPAVDASCAALGRREFCGRVADASRAAHKRARYELETEGGRVSVICYHKAANMLCEGDEVAVSGWLVRDGDAPALLQLLPAPDAIVWFSSPVGS